MGWEREKHAMPIPRCVELRLAAVHACLGGMHESTNRLRALCSSLPTSDTRSLSVLNVKRCRLAGRSPTSSSESDMATLGSEELAAVHGRL